METIHFLQQFRAVFPNPHFMIPMQLYITDDKYANFPLMADKIRVRSTDKGLLCSKMTKR